MNKIKCQQELENQFVRLSGKLKSHSHLISDESVSYNQIEYMRNELMSISNDIVRLSQDVESFVSGKHRGTDYWLPIPHHLKLKLK